jgi:hypothetical protein
MFAITLNKSLWTQCESQKEQTNFLKINWQYESQKEQTNFLNTKSTIWFTKRINQLFKYYIDNMRGGWSRPLWQKKKKDKINNMKNKNKKEKERKCV